MKRPLFTRSHYEAIAEVMANTLKQLKERQCPPEGYFDGFTTMYKRTVALFEEDNLAFKPDVFRTAVYGKE
jgi:hypothetical protein